MKIRDEEFFVEINKRFEVSDKDGFVEAVANLLRVLITEMVKPEMEKGSYRVRRQNADYFIIYLRMKGATVFIEYRILKEEHGGMEVEFAELDIWD
jgi:hypothetical protein